MEGRVYMISFILYHELFPILENLITQWPGCFWHLHTQHNIPKSIFVRSQIPMDSTCRCINCFTNLHVLLCLSILLKILLFLFLLCVIVRALCWFVKSYVYRYVIILHKFHFKAVQGVVLKREGISLVG